MGFDSSDVRGLGHILDKDWEVGGERVSVSELFFRTVEVLGVEECEDRYLEYGLIRLSTGVLIFRYLTIRFQDGRKHVIMEHREVVDEDLLRDYVSDPSIICDKGLGRVNYYVRTSGDDIDHLELDWVVDIVSGESEEVVYEREGLDR